MKSETVLQPGKYYKGRCVGSTPLSTPECMLRIGKWFGLAGLGTTDTPDGREFRGRFRGPKDTPASELGPEIVDIEEVKGVEAGLGKLALIAIGLLVLSSRR